MHDIQLGPASLRLDVQPDRRCSPTGVRSDGRRDRRFKLPPAIHAARKGLSPARRWPEPRGASAPRVRALTARRKEEAKRAKRALHNSYYHKRKLKNPN